MGTSRIAKVALGIWMLFPLTAHAQTVIAVLTDREAFEKRLGDGLQVIGFDDVKTEDADPVGFKPDRYADKTGAIIIGHARGGQFVSRSFDFPGEFVPSSAPNMYAPGPISRKTGEARVTSVTFSVERRAGVVAGFGAVFIDADYPRLGPSYLKVYDADGKLLGTTGTISGRNASQLFRGIITVDVDSGKPVAAIAKVQIVSGDEWPSVDIREGVALDDFVFSRPEALVRTHSGMHRSTRSGVKQAVASLARGR